MGAEYWYITLGALLVIVTLTGTIIQRLPLTATIVYLLAGIIIGPLGFDLTRIDAFQRAGLIERLAEIGVIVSLFTTGLMLRLPFHYPHWKITGRLAFLSMAVTVCLVAAVGYFGLGLSLGLAILLGAILAPTDPVLASEVQLESLADKDKLRFSLTGEAGLNDGTAFPFVMLGLGFLGLHELGSYGWRWIAVDLLWGVAGGLGIGALFGVLASKLVLHLRVRHESAFGREEFLAFGIIGLTYGVALLLHAYGFLAVFAAGLAIRHLERRHTGPEPPPSLGALASEPDVEKAKHPAIATAYLAEALLESTKRAEKLLEVGLVLVLGLMLTPAVFTIANLWFAPLLFLVIRPISVSLGLLGCRPSGREWVLLSWFGIRGVGSIYYLMYAIAHGISEGPARELITITLATITVSILIHGASVTPLMNWHHARQR